MPIPLSEVLPVSLALVPKKTVTVDIWSWRLVDATCEVARLSGYMTRDELARADAFVFEPDRLTYRMGRGRLREILGCYLGMPPGSVAIFTNSHGKPWVEGLSFNLSHSGGWAVLAVSRDRIDLGVDIEAHRPVEKGLAAATFSAVERAELAAGPPDGSVAAFFRLWTRKEAFVKARGMGLSIPLQDFDVTVGRDQPRITRIERGDASDWQVVNLPLHHRDMAGSVVVRSGGSPVRLHPLGGALTRRLESATIRPAELH